MQARFKSRRSASGLGAVLVLIALLSGLGTPVFGQSDYDEKIEELEQALEEIKASIRQGDDV